MADKLTLLVTFPDESTRDRFKELCNHLGHEEHALAQRLLTRFIDYCESCKKRQNFNEVILFVLFYFAVLCLYCLIVYSFF